MSTGASARHSTGVPRCRLGEEVAALQARCRAVEAASKHTQAELQQLRSARGAAAVVAALPPLPGGGGAPAGVLSPKQAKAAPSAIDGVVALVRKLRQAPLPAAAQKLADKLEASTQVRTSARAEACLDVCGTGEWPVSPRPAPHLCIAVTILRHVHCIAEVARLDYPPPYC